MFEATSDGKIPFHVVLQCAVNALTSKIITNESDYVGVCFFGSVQKKNSNDFESVYVACPLDRPSAQVILALENMISCGARARQCGEKPVAHRIRVVGRALVSDRGADV